LHKLGTLRCILKLLLASKELRLGSYPRNDRRVPHISLVFGEMWDTAGLPLKSAAGSAAIHGCSTFALHQNTRNLTDR
jgi:hypothetical protein